MYRDVHASEAIFLLDVDADFGAGVAPASWSSVRHATRVDAFTLMPKRCLNTQAGGALLLIAGGLLIREQRLGDRIASELAGPGDVVDTSMTNDLLPSDVIWRATSASRVVVLTPQVVGALPVVVAHNVMRAAARRASRLGTAQTISQLPRVDDRVLALFGQLAERWGHVTPDGVRLHLDLTHEMIGQLVGAARPTVSLALKSLTRGGDVVHDRSGWLLRPEALGGLRPQAAPDADSVSPPASWMPVAG